MTRFIGSVFIILVLTYFSVSADDGSKQVSEKERPASVEAGVRTKMKGSINSTTVWGYSVKFEPEQKRNPMLSPDDVQKLREMERQKRLEMLRRNKKKVPDVVVKKVPRKRSLSSVAKSIELQGIIGEQAIINGVISRPGAMVNGATVVKVGYDYVIFSYSGKRFKKSIK